MNNVLTISVDLLQAHYICLWFQDLIQQQLLSRRPKQRLLRHLQTVLSLINAFEQKVGTTPYQVPILELRTLTKSPC